MGKKKAGRLIKNPYLPPMQKTNKLLATNNNDKKAKIFIKRFSPQPALADFNNITSKTPATHLKINSNMTIKKMAKTISCLLNNTVPKPNKIPNKALKTCGPLITF